MVFTVTQRKNKSRSIPWGQEIVMLLEKGEIGISSSFESVCTLLKVVSLCFRVFYVFA